MSDRLTLDVLVKHANPRTAFNVYETNPFDSIGNRKNALVKNRKKHDIHGDVLNFTVTDYQPYDFSMDVWVYNPDNFEKMKTEWEQSMGLS